MHLSFWPLAFILNIPLSICKKQGVSVNSSWRRGYQNKSNQSPWMCLPAECVSASVCLWGFSCVSIAWTGEHTHTITHTVRRKDTWVFGSTAKPLSSPWWNSMKHLKTSFFFHDLVWHPLLQTEPGDRRRGGIFYFFFFLLPLSVSPHLT